MGRTPHLPLISHFPVEDVESGFSCCVIEGVIDERRELD